MKMRTKLDLKKMVMLKYIKLSYVESVAVILCIDMYIYIIVFLKTIFLWVFIAKPKNT